MSLPPILMFGATGQLAQALRDRADLNRAQLIALSRDKADLQDPDAICRAVAGAPDGAIVINAAAYTAVDKAESEPDIAAAINATAPGVMAAVARERGLRFIHVSTDYVFDGTKAGAYVEDDETNPLGVYGRTKLEGEHAVAAAHPDAAIVRTSWVYSPYGANFLKTMLRVGAERDELRVVDDQVGAPTSAHDIADGLFALIKAKGASGLFHLTGSGEASWADFADAIFAHQAPFWGRRPTVTRITTADYPTPASRPQNSRMNCDRIDRVCGFRTPDWHDSMAEILTSINKISGHSRRF